MQIWMAALLSAIIFGGGGYFAAQNLSQQFAEETESEQAEIESQGASTTATTIQEANFEEERMQGDLESVSTSVLSEPEATQMTYTPPPTPNTDQKSILKPDFEVRCRALPERIDEGETAEIELTIFEKNGTFGINNDYSFNWSENDLSEEGDKKGLFRFNVPGKQDITATVARKSDGMIGTVTCSVDVEAMSINLEKVPNDENDPAASIVSQINEWIETNILLKDVSDNPSFDVDEIYVIDTYADNVYSQAEVDAETELRRLFDLLSLHTPSQTAEERMLKMINYSPNIPQHERIADFISYWNAWKKQLGY